MRTSFMPAAFRLVRKRRNLSSPSSRAGRGMAEPHRLREAATSGGKLPPTGKCGAALPEGWPPVPGGAATMPGGSAAAPWPRDLLRPRPSGAASAAHVPSAFNRAATRPRAFLELGSTTGARVRAWSRGPGRATCSWGPGRMRPTSARTALLLTEAVRSRDCHAARAIPAGKNHRPACGGDRPRETSGRRGVSTGRRLNHAGRWNPADGAGDCRRAGAGADRPGGRPAARPRSARRSRSA